ncbi:hypothetical protein CPAR01_11736 [Colletotrichum paranaense]|uniref:Uncharacterized protein n=1 Tax=Colletotrichum paranaense TaxID=1914294 RepID=A0ABQ9S807_9PEZI|nr:uncharacterized protein CPAR01_11736 [Colletotrichum paranaense]KAK1529424.1 hypothetical protein CPAR01_11736 [Colletotrichum paranaense]
MYPVPDKHCPGSPESPSARTRLRLGCSPISWTLEFIASHCQSRIIDPAESRFAPKYHTTAPAIALIRPPAQPWLCTDQAAQSDVANAIADEATIPHTYMRKSHPLISTTLSGCRNRHYPDPCFTAAHPSGAHAYASHSLFPHPLVLAYPVSTIQATVLVVFARTPHHQRPVEQETPIYYRFRFYLRHNQ